MTFFEEQFVSTVRRLVREKPDFIYQLPEIWSDHLQDFVKSGSCMYVELDPESDKLCGSCLLGQALLELGVDVNILYQGGDHKNNSQSFDHLAAELELPLRAQVIEWAATVQRYQDNNRPWGEALRLADEQFPQLGL
ncbi:MAG: hypothetical protein EON54_07505 [Alcaligenaceae bacterium]|nr:MAG: hypothetical protein EON54_07505 [Alcaligenaceae bacterium]